VPWNLRWLMMYLDMDYNKLKHRMNVLNNLSCMWFVELNVLTFQCCCFLGLWAGEKSCSNGIHNSRISCTSDFGIFRGVEY